MAYLTTLASVSPDDVGRLVADATHLLSPSRWEFVSHHLAYGLPVEPLGELFGQAIDGGAPINPDLWHPLRPPIVHSPEAVRDLHSQIRNAWDVQLAEHELPDGDWYRIEIEKLLAVFGHAAKHGQCVVDIVHPPTDAERADRVRVPIRRDAR